ncbi:tryptophan-rich sensory protein [bacterium]|nr:tryptophan-rich sensory protein [bacterium]
MNNWYQSLIKPEITPPAIFFSVVWMFLYIFMAVSFAIVFSDLKFRDKTVPLSLFLIQLALNLLWSPVFFLWHNVVLALCIAILLFIFVLATTIVFFKHSKIAGFLFIPYVIWCGCAIWLNYKILILN